MVDRDPLQIVLELVRAAREDLTTATLAIEHVTGDLGDPIATLLRIGHRLDAALVMYETIRRTKSA